MLTLSGWYQQRNKYLFDHVSVFLLLKLSKCVTYIYEKLINMLLTVKNMKYYVIYWQLYINIAILPVWGGVIPVH